MKDFIMVVGTVATALIAGAVLVGLFWLGWEEVTKLRYLSGGELRLKEKIQALENNLNGRIETIVELRLELEELKAGRPQQEGPYR